MATSINYFWVRNKYSEQVLPTASLWRPKDASLSCYEILQGHKYFLIASCAELVEV